MFDQLNWPQVQDKDSHEHFKETLIIHAYSIDHISLDVIQKG